MIASLILPFLGIGIPDWLKGPLKWLADAAVLILLLAGTYFWIHHDGEKKGAATVTAKVERDHAARVVEAQADTAKAQTTADAIGATTRHSNELATQFARAQIEELRNATTLPPAPAGAPAPVVDGVRIDASLNALIDRAGRAAETADREP